MNKPQGYDSVTVGGDFTPIELGGHTAVIKRVRETTSSNGKPMIQIAIDFDNRDSQPGYFTEMFKNDTRQDRKWPYQGTQYILTEDRDGKCSRQLKSFITSVEQSNNAECDWGPAFEGWFVNKRVGIVYGEVEEPYQGEIKTRRRIRYFCNYDKAKSADIPEKKLYKKPATTITTPTADFVNVPDGALDEIPF